MNSTINNDVVILSLEKELGLLLQWGNTQNFPNHLMFEKWPWTKHVEYGTCGDETAANISDRQQIFFVCVGLKYVSTKQESDMQFMC